MSSITDIPQIVYLDSSQVDTFHSLLNHGRIEEIIKRSRETGSSASGIGIRKIIELIYSESSENEDETEEVIKNNNIGKFAMLYDRLDESNDIKHVDAMETGERENLSERDFIEASGQVYASPINELHDFLENIRPMMDVFGISMQDEADSEFDFDEIQNLLAELRTGEDFYRMDASGSLNVDIVFPLYEENWRTSHDNFPSKFIDYQVLGRVEHVYDAGEERLLVDVIDSLPDIDRDARVQKKRFLRQMADASTELLGRHIDESDFMFSYPDIQINPVAIYS